MRTIDLIEKSRRAAEIAWNAVNVSDPATVGYFKTHEGVTREEHEYARSLLAQHPADGSVITLENGARVGADTLMAAQNVADYLERGTGWGQPFLATDYRADAWLAVATMTQYQSIIRQQAGGDMGAKAEEGMQKVLERFAGAYQNQMADPKKLIDQVREQVNPVFEDGTRLSDHQRSKGPGRAPDARVDPLSIRSLASRLTGHDAQQQENPRRGGPEAFTGIGPGSPSS